MNVLSYENAAVKRWAFVGVLIIFTAECLCHPIQMAGIETILELHILTKLLLICSIICKFKDSTMAIYDTALTYNNLFGNITGMH